VNKAAVLDNNKNTTVVLLRGFLGFREMEGNITPKGSVSFRDSDVEFLQTQAREWLEAMLGEKLEQEGRTLAEILANGAILYRVSQLMKELIRTKLGNNKNNNNIAPSDILHSPGSSKMLASPDIVVSKGSKNSQMYLPYSYVEAFLKVSKDMVGLLDVDLFNPSDAVDMKDIRRVCVCLRRLSKKARAQQLPVPDFDNVAQTMTTPIHKLAMPTEFVHGLKESLQKSASKSYYNTSDLIMSKETSSSIADLRKPEAQSSSVGNGSNNGFEESEKAGVSDEVHYEEQQSSGNSNKPSSTPSLPAFLHTEQERTRAEEDEPQDTRDYSIAHKSSIFHREEEEEARPSYATTEQQGFGSSSSNKLPRTTSTTSSKSGQETAATGKKGGKRKTSLPWFPVLAGVVVFVGTFLALTLSAQRQQEHDYEVKKGDTLSLISRRAGKSNWQELVHSNPHISNPDLIYPSERLKL
jgi:LysM repeat protein